MKNKILSFFDHDMKVLLNNVSWQFSSQIIVSLVTFLKVIIITRSLSLDEYGHYVIILAFLAIVHLFFQANVGTASIKFYADFIEKKEKHSVLALIKLNFLILTLLSILYIGIVAILASLMYEVFFDKIGLYNYIITFAFILTFEYYGEIFIALLRFYDKFKQSAMIFIFTSLVEITLLFFITSNINNTFENIIATIIFARFISITLRFTISWILLKKELMGLWSSSLYNIKKDIKPYISFVFNNSLTKLVTASAKRGDVLILGYLIGKESVAVYDIAKKLAFMLHTIRGPLEITIMPQLAKLVSANKISNLKTFLFKLTKISILSSIAIYFILYFIAGDLISNIFGQQYIKAEDYFVILLLSVLIEFAFFWMAPLYVSLGKVKERLKIVTFSILFSFLWSYPLVINFGSIGMSYVMLMSIILIYSISLWFLLFKRKKIKSIGEKNEKF